MVTHTFEHLELRSCIRTRQERRNSKEHPDNRSLDAVLKQDLVQNGDLVIAIERDRHGITKLVVASPNPLKDKSGSPEIKWLSVWDHTKITPETTESVRAAVEIAEKNHETAD